MRLAVRRIDRECPLRRIERLLGAVLAHVQPGELGRNVRGLRIERHRALERRYRAVDVVAGFEMMGEKKLLVRLRRTVSRRLLGSSRRQRRRDDRRRHETFHM